MEEIFTLEDARKHMKKYVPEGNPLIVKWNKVGNIDLEGEEIFTMYKDSDGTLVVDTFHIDAFDDGHTWNNPDWGNTNEMIFNKEKLKEMLKLLEAE